MRPSKIISTRTENGVTITEYEEGYAWGYGCHGNYSNMGQEDLGENGKIPLGIDLKAVYEPENRASGYELFNQDRTAFKKATQTVFKKRNNFLENSSCNKDTGIIF